MCGIVGCFSHDNSTSIGLELIDKMAASITHRGPDDDGFYHDDNIALGFRRLSIIDLESGHQPIHNEDESVWTVFNGEIYNYRELRLQLEALGHVFYTHSDTEVLVHLYEEYGEDLVHHLRGMFCFCIWDIHNERLLLCRDRLGIKQVFYTEKDGNFIFGSELKALLATGLVDKNIDVTALDHYLGFQYIPAPFTIYSDVRKLPPGHMISVTKGSKAEIRQYWDISSIEAGRMTLNESIEGFEQLFIEAVRLRLRSDVPLGAFLSGGVDSSAVVAVMSELMDSPVNTFTICHTDKRYDESEYARIISNKFGTIHRTLTIGADDFLRLVPSVLEQYDEPFADSSALPTHIVSMLARQHVKVVLSGDGGDETCAGYKKYDRISRLGHMGRLLGTEGLLTPGARGRLREMASLGQGPINKLLKYAVNLLATDRERHYFFMSYLREAKNQLYGEALRYRFDVSNDLTLYSRYMDAIPGDDMLRKILYLDIKTYLADDILYKVDIASMANSLEVRVPLLDHKLVEFVASVPSEYKLNNGIGKLFFKKMLEKRLPHDILYRRKKGFEIPISSWFRGELARYIRDLLLSSELLCDPYFNRTFIEDLICKHQKGNNDFGPQLWILMSLELWHRKWGGSFNG